MDQNTILVYDAISEDYNRSFSMPSAHIDDFLSLLSPTSFVLDAGCGPGTDAVYINSLGHLVIGIDFSEQMILLAKEKSMDIPFVCKDMRKLDFNSDFFDGILAAYSLIHVPKEDVKSCLYNFRRMLHPSGILCLGLQEGKDGLKKSGPLNPKLELMFTLFSLPEITELLHETGFKILLHHHIEPTTMEALDSKRMCIIAQKAR